MPEVSTITNNAHNATFSQAVDTFVPGGVNVPYVRPLMDAKLRACQSWSHQEFRVR